MGPNEDVRDLSTTHSYHSFWREWLKNPKRNNHLTIKARQSCITSKCFDIAKLWCLWLNIIGYFFSLSYMPMHDMLKMKKNVQRKSKAKRIKMLLNMVASVFLGDVGVIGCTLKVIVPIKQLWLCVSVFDFLISQIVIIWDTYALLLCFHIQHANSLLLLIRVQLQCDLAITRNTCVNIYSLNCLNLFLKYKIG